MLKFYYNLAPNPMKVALLLEELGMDYDAIPVDTRKGEQHSEAFRRINPNAKVPAIDDEGTIVFDSNAILLYLGDKTGRFVPLDLGNDTHGLTARLLKQLACFVDICRIAYERQGEIIESLRGSEANVLKIFVGQRWRGNATTFAIHTFAIRQFTARDHLGIDARAVHGRDFEDD